MSKPAAFDAGKKEHEMKPDHPKLAAFLKAYRAKNGAESVQVTKSNALWPLKAARAWTKHVKA